jgi:hypothetical protein
MMWMEKGSLTYMEASAGRFWGSFAKRCGCENVETAMVYARAYAKENHKPWPIERRFSKSSSWLWCLSSKQIRKLEASGKWPDAEMYIQARNSLVGAADKVRWLPS